jgi:hypothetical protein
MSVSHGDRALSWRERLRRYASSSFTVAEFCRREGVSVANFYCWRRRLADASPSVSAKRASSERGLQASPAFQPLLLSGVGVVTVELAGGARIELPAEAGLVRAVVAELLAGVRSPGGV